MDVTVIIPCGRPDRLPQLLAALRNQTVHPAEIIVVSNTADAQAEDATLVRTPELYPPGRMRNEGAARARTAVLAFIDDDCLPPPEWLERALPLLEDAEVGGVGCRVIAAKDSFWNRCADYALFNCYQAYRKLQIPLGSAALLVRAAAYRQAGGFDVNLLASEDWDFSLKLLSAGWRCWFVPDVDVAHDHGRGSIGAILRQAHHSGRQTGLAVLKRHYRNMSLLARLSVPFASPFLYWIVILPYALLASVLQTLPAIRYDLRVVAFWPVVLLGDFAYQLGVFMSLCRAPGRLREAHAG